MPYCGFIQDFCWGVGEVFDAAGPRNMVSGMCCKHAILGGLGHPPQGKFENLVL